MHKVCIAVSLLWALSAQLYGQVTPPVSSPDTLVDARLKALERNMSAFKNLKITGYVQAQWQLAQQPGIHAYAGGDFPAQEDNRFMIRRGRVKFTFTDDLYQLVAQPDLNERAITLREFYGVVTEPWLKRFSLTAGLFNRPFSYENLYSSSVRETPERARFQQVLLANERDQGAMLTWKWKDVKVDGGFFNGNSIAAESDRYKDFIGRAAYTKAWKRSSIGVGASGYLGQLRQTTNHVYKYQPRMADHEAGMLLVDTTHQMQLNRAAPRRYWGADAQYSLDWAGGKTTLRAELVGGLQPGLQNSNESAKTKDGLVGDIYLRKTQGGLVYFVQNLGKSHFQAVIKYDWLDPNTDVTGGQIGSPGANLGAADLAYQTWGFGLNFLWKHWTLMAYYDWVRNEKAPNLPGYGQDLRDNVLTLRSQVKF